MPLIVRKHLAVGFYALWLWGAIANTGTTEVFQKEVLSRIDATMHAAIREHRLPGGVFWLEHLESSSQPSHKGEKVGVFLSFSQELRASFQNVI